jgi:hypothetical protein
VSGCFLFGYIADEKHLAWEKKDGIQLSDKRGHVFQTTYPAKKNSDWMSEGN